MYVIIPERNAFCAFIQQFPCTKQRHIAWVVQQRRKHITLLAISKHDKPKHRAVNIHIWALTWSAHTTNFPRDSSISGLTPIYTKYWTSVQNVPKEWPGIYIYALTPWHTSLAKYTAPKPVDSGLIKIPNGMKYLWYVHTSRIGVRWCKKNLQFFQTSILTSFSCQCTLRI